MKARFLRFWLFLLTLGVCGASAEPGTIYFSLGSDTAVWNWPGGVDIYVRTNHFIGDLYTSPGSRSYQVMDPAFRRQFTDSFGNPLKLTWWMLVGSVYGVTDNHDVPVPNLMPLYLMQKYHGPALRAAGDELTLHYHTFLWSDYAGNGTYYWNQARTFHEQRADFDKAIAQSLLEENVFTVTFRSGWHYMDNEWQAYANQLWPYNMDNDSPNKTGPPYQPFFNVLDWSLATTNFIPYQPFPANYQLPGGSSGWNTRSVKMPNVGQAMVDNIFGAAAGGTNEVVSFWAHLPEVDFLSQIARMDLLIHAAAAKYPGVRFRYCTATEAMQRWRGLQDNTPPDLQVSETTAAGVTTLHLKSSEPIYQTAPFVAVKDISENVRILPCVVEGTNAWAATLPFSKASLAKWGVAVTDPAGNLTTRIGRYIPDDVFVDNLDAGYGETSGSWTNTTTAAWGIDSRGAMLQPGEKAAAQWVLPVTEQRPYIVSIQVPASTNAPASSTYTIEADGEILATRHFDRPMLPYQWMPLATVALDPSRTNFLKLAALGADGGPSWAMADVVKLSPLIQPQDFIRSVENDAGETTANVLFQTAAPASVVVEYGEDIRYGKQASVDAGMGTNHVATLTGLVPGEIYQYQIRANLGGTNWVTAQGQVIPRGLAGVRLTNETVVFGLQREWLYNTNNLDGVPWQAAGYDDTSWPSGQGLLWVESKTGILPAEIQPQGTRMPFDPATKYPYITYYFRAHFDLTNRYPIGAFVFTNYIDDGAIFYLDGTEIYRNNFPPAPAVITNAAIATGANCGGVATCPVVFRLGWAASTNIAAGPHVLAVEVHNNSEKSADIVFGGTLSYFETSNPAPALKFSGSGESPILYWNGEGWSLQQSSDLSQGEAGWLDASPGSPWLIPEGPPRYFRLKRAE